MEKEAVELLLAIVDFLLYPHHLAPSDNHEKKDNLRRRAMLFEESLK